MASSIDQRRDLKFMLRPTLSSFSIATSDWCRDLRLVSRPQIGVETSDSSLNVPSVLATLPLSQRLLLGALVFLVATSLSCCDLA